MRGALALAVAALGVACGSGPDPEPISNRSPGDVARALFALADGPASMGVGPGDVVDEATYARDPAALDEALEALAGITRVRVVAEEPLPGLDRVAVDVEGERAGPALVAVTVQAEPRGDGTWRVRWFAGPGVEWPESSRPGDPEPVSSPAPDSAVSRTR